MDDLTAERFGREIPWREASAWPSPPDVRPEDEMTKARRRRILCVALDDGISAYRTGRRVA